MPAYFRNSEGHSGHRGHTTMVNITGELIIKKNMINPPLSFFGDFLKIIKPPSTFSREAREIFWAFWAFNGDFLTKFGKF